MNKKNIFFVKVLLNVLFCLKIFFPVALIFTNKRVFCSSECINTPKISKELKDKLDQLRAHQLLSSVNSFEGLSSLITNNEWEELELEKFLDNWSAYTKTKFDLWGLKFLLKYSPEGSKDFLKILVYDDKVFNDLEEIMEKVVCAQDFLISYWDDLDELNCKSKKLYFSLFSKIAPKINIALNGNKASLEVLNALNYAWPIYNFCAAFGLESVLIKYCFCKLVNKNIKPVVSKNNFGENNFGENNFNVFGQVMMEKFSETISNRPELEFNGVGPELIYYFKSKINEHSIFPNVYKNGYDYCRIQEIGEFSLADKWIFLERIFLNLFDKVEMLKTGNINHYLSKSISLITVLGFQAFMDYIVFARIKDSIELIRFLHSTTTELQKNLVSVSDMLRGLCQINNRSFSFDGKDVAAVANIKNFLYKKDLSKKAKELLENLFSKTFKSKSELFFSRSTLLYTHKLMNELKQEFLAPFLQNVAVLGGYLALAKIFRAHENSRAKYCFVEFIDSEKPFISIEGAWLPLIKQESVVLNDIHFGVDGVAGNAIITGPNGGGKSTFMMMVAFNVLLSKLGIVAAQKAMIGDFCAIRTSLRPLQDISSGLSTFMAESKRASDVKKTVQSCSGNILVLFDEPYKGTVEAESEKRIYNIAGQLAKNNSHCCMLLATHLKKPIELESDFVGLFKNYQMGYLEKESGVFERTFKILDGPALWWFDDDLKRERFIDWLCSSGSSF